MGVKFLQQKYENISKREGFNHKLAYEYVINDEREHVSNWICQYSREQEEGKEDMAEVSLEYAGELLEDIQGFKSFRRKYINLKGIN